MAVHLMLRYTSTGYPVRVFVNGFLLINDLAGERSGTRVEPYVLPGRNGLRLDTTQAERDASVTLQLVLIPDDGGADERVLLDLQYPDGGLSIGVVERSFELPAMLPRWAWANLQPAPAEANERSARVFLAELGGLIAAGPDEQLLARLDYKHREIGQAAGIGQARMDTGLLKGLEARRATAGWRVRVAEAQDLVLLWSPDRHVARAMLRDWQDAIQLFNGRDWTGFQVTLGFSQGHWIVIR